MKIKWIMKDLKTSLDDTTFSKILDEVKDNLNIRLSRLKYYENLEKKLGINLDVLLYALENGVYFTSIKEIGNVEFCESPKLKYFDIRDEYHLVDYDGTYAKLTDYGVSWALTKEELL